MKKKLSNYASFGGAMTNIPFFKKKGWKIFLSFFAVIFILLVSFAAYTIATGSKIFDTNLLGGAPFFKSVTGAASLKGEGDGRINILFMGMGGANHPGGKLTDSMMVVSIDPNNKKLAVLSIPRDLYVPVEGTKISTKINEVYSIGEKEKKGTGPDLIKKTLGNVLDLPIHYYVSADFEGFTKTIDRLGGVDVNVEKAINDPMYPDENMSGYDPFKISEGQHHLDGATALKYARSRYTSSDFDRAARQQKIMIAAKQKALTLGFLANPKKIFDLINIAGDHIRTDFTINEIKSLANMASDFSKDDIATEVLTNADDGPLYSDSSSGTFLLLPKDKTWKGVQRIAHEIFTDPYLQKENAKIEILNGSAISGQAVDLSQTLKSYGYNVISIEKAPEQYKKTLIYDYTSGQKEFTLKFLKDRLKADIVKKDQKILSKDAEISIIIGNDYESIK